LVISCKCFNFRSGIAPIRIPVEVFSKIITLHSKWGEQIKNVEKHDKDVLRAIISANNHYPGFGPATLSTFREIMEIPQISLDQRNGILFPKYSSYFSHTGDERDKNSSSESADDTIQKSFLISLAKVFFFHQCTYERYLDSRYLFKRKVKIR
jgi:hypothetical protein